MIYTEKGDSPLAGRLRRPTGSIPLFPCARLDLGQGAAIFLSPTMQGARQECRASGIKIVCRAVQRIVLRTFFLF